MLPFEPLSHVPTEFLLLWFVVPFRQRCARRPAILLRLAPGREVFRRATCESGLARRALAVLEDVLYVKALHDDPSATLDNLREAVTTLEETAPIARRVFGGAHPTTVDIEKGLRLSRAALRARETPPPPRSA